MSSLLGSMAPDTSCVMELTWTSAGSREYQNMLQLKETDIAQIHNDLDRGRTNILELNKAANGLEASDVSNQKHAYFNYRQYVGNSNR